MVCPCYMSIFSSFGSTSTIPQFICNDTSLCEANIMKSSFMLPKRLHESYRKNLKYLKKNHVHPFSECCYCSNVEDLEVNKKKC